MVHPPYSPRDFARNDRHLAQIARGAGSFTGLGRIFRTNSERWFPDLHATTTPNQLAVHYALGLGGEVGEVLNLVKKGNRYGEAPDFEAIAGEIADTFVYLVLLADQVGVDVLDAVQAKQRVCEQRWGVDRSKTEHPAKGQAS